MKKIILYILTFCILTLLVGCKQETQLVESFNLKEGSFIEINVDIEIKYSHSGIYFDLENIPASHISRDFSDYMQVFLYDSKGSEYIPGQIYDLNGARTTIFAGFLKYSKGTQFKKIKIVALKDFSGSSVRWWTGDLE